MIGKVKEFTGEYRYGLWYLSQMLSLNPLDSRDHESAPAVLVRAPAERELRQQKLEVIAG